MEEILKHLQRNILRTSHRTNGGKIGWFSEGMDQKLELELSKIDKNEISEPFQTNNGWHIIQYTDTKIEDMRSREY
jgi:peptidyl-prolyl cis-trans isomerase SurA